MPTDDETWDPLKTPPDEWRAEPGQMIVVPPPRNLLEEMMQMQLSAQLNLAEEKGGGNPADLRSPEYILMHVTAAKAELQELLDETGWKAWSKDRNFVNIEEARGEWIDAWHFFMNLALTLEMTPEMIYDMYAEKRLRNLKRWENDYDARRGKCKGCGRDLSDLIAHDQNAALHFFQAGPDRIFHNEACYEEHKFDE
jgi:hypothetical protein